MMRLASLQSHLQAVQSDLAPDIKIMGEFESQSRVPQSGRLEIEQERKQASFNVREMSYFLDDGEEATKLREKIMTEFERDPTFRMDDVHDLTRPQVRARVMTRLRSMIQWITTESVATFQLRLGILILVDPGFLTRMAVHYGLFLNTIMGQGTPEQVSYWVSKGAVNFHGIIGCYAMTELGHGSNVAGVETIATFDPESDEFIIHTPSLTATKWWIGGAAESATHSVVFAHLIIKGKRYGVKPFVVQLRNPEDFTLLPGINIGDCGAKMGRNAIDNGWIQFTFVRIPRTNMLMKYTKVSRDGSVTEPPIAQLAYGSLIYGRTSIIRESIEAAKKALTIAIRYSVVRRQFAGKKGQLENKIMDYKTHQQRLIPLLALQYAMNFAGLEATRIYDHVLSILDVAKPGDPRMVEALDALKETHATSAGLKAFCTWKTLDMIEQCRQACGGLGYSSYTGLASLFQDFAVQCTWEGDNTVLTLQAGRYLISCIRDRMKGKKVPKGVNYINLMPSILKKTCSSSNVTDLEVIGEAFDMVCANFAANAAKAFQSLLDKGLGENEAYEKGAVQRFNAAKMHCTGYLFHQFKNGLDRAPFGLKPILTRLCMLYGLSAIQDNAGSFLQYGYFKPTHIDAIQSKILELLDELRPQVIPLTDAFNLTDYIINSPLGCADGDVYRRMFDRVRQFNPQGSHQYFDNILKPVLLRKDAPPEKLDIE